MPTEVQRRPSDPLPSHPGSRDHFAAHDARTAHQATSSKQQQLQHREALRLALGSILTPKRPPLSSSSRSSSGTASPAYFGFHSASGTHTPVGTPPASATAGSYHPPAYGPNSSEHLHLHHPHHGHPLPPSRLRPTRSTSSNTPSPSGSSPNSVPNSAHPSPHPKMISPTTLPVPSDIEPLPPAGPPQDAHSPGVRPAVTPLQPKDGAVEAFCGSEKAEATVGGAAGTTQSASGSSTPKAKFLQTLQSKSAWDALIHGSFS